MPRWTTTVRLTDLGTDASRVMSISGARQEIGVGLETKVPLLMDSNGTLWPSANTSGRLPVAVASGGGPFPAFSASDVVVLVNGQAAGNGAITTAGPLGAGIYEIWGFYYTYLANGVAGTRTTSSALLKGLFNSNAAGFATLDFYSSATLSLTATQGGFVALVPGGVEVKNQAGTITYATSKLWLPCLAITYGAGSLNLGVGAAGAADPGDVHRCVILGRQIA